MRRIHLPEVIGGQLVLPDREAHHVRNVLRLREGAFIEVFDDGGRTALATIVHADDAKVIVHIDTVRQPPPAALTCTIASAIPKGPRADWMIEKLSELGTRRFIPLDAARSIVLPEGHSKRQRWIRLAAEAAKQSRRVGVMTIDELTPVEQLVPQLNAPAWYLSTQSPAVQIAAATDTISHHPPDTPLDLTLLIGPEGGWTAAELAIFQKAGLTAVTLGATILRVETAAVAAAAIVAAIVKPAFDRRSLPQPGPTP